MNTSYNETANQSLGFIKQVHQNQYTNGLSQLLLNKVKIAEVRSLLQASLNDTTNRDDYLRAAAISANAASQSNRQYVSTAAPSVVANNLLIARASAALLRSVI